MREWFGDFKKIKDIDMGYKRFNRHLFEKRMRMNRKQKILLMVRKARKPRAQIKIIL